MASASGTSTNSKPNHQPNKWTKSHSTQAQEPKEIPVELGFIEEKESWKLCSPFFPSKLGGKPSWLNLGKLPQATDLKCISCDEPTRFLLQIYCPLDEESSFHRSIFLFICTNTKCCVERNCNKNLVAIRSSLGLVNDYYASTPPDYNEELSKIGPTTFGIKLCRVCGGIGEKHCSACKKVNYCSKEHQTMDWTKRHKPECSNPDFQPEEPSSPSFLSFKEYEIVIDKEVIPKNKPGKSDKKNEMKEYEKLVAEGKAGTLENSEVSKDMLEAASYKSDKSFNKFRKRIAYEPEQILRYDRGGEPLWVSSEKIPVKDDIPPCSNCNSPRIFEFQVMPQLLNHLGEESVLGSLDWGTLVVYSCEKNCTSESGSPIVEFVWQQDFKLDSDKDE